MLAFLRPTVGSYSPVTRVRYLKRLGTTGVLLFAAEDARTLAGMPEAPWDRMQRAFHQERRGPVPPVLHSPWPGPPPRPELRRLSPVTLNPEQVIPVVSWPQIMPRIAGPSQWDFGKTVT